MLRRAIDAERARGAFYAQSREPGGERGRASPRSGGGGGSPWITGTYGRIFTLLTGCVAGEPWHRKSRGEKDGQALFFDSMLASIPQTASSPGHQFIPGESFDIDEHYEFINVDIPTYARKSGFEMGKAGVLWHLDRETGQLIRAMDTGLQNMMIIDPEKGFVDYRPEVINAPMGKPLYTCPSTSGHKNARQMAYNPQTRAFYIPMSLNCSTRVYLPAGENGSSAAVLPRERIPAGLQRHGGAGAGARLRKRCGPTASRRLASPAMTTAGGFVFVGDTDLYMMAFDANTGRSSGNHRACSRSCLAVGHLHGQRTAVCRLRHRRRRAQLDFNRRRELDPDSHWPQAGSGMWSSRSGSNESRNGLH